MNKLNSNLYLSDILKRFPDTLEVFLANGFKDFVENNAIMQISPFVKLKTIFKARGINEKYFMTLLEEKINSSHFDDLLKQLQLDVKDRMNLLALLPCPLKLPLQQSFNSFIHEEHIDDAHDLDYLIEGNANNQLSYYQYVEQFEDIDEIPDIIISPGINSFFYKDFRDKFIDKGLFIDAAQYLPNQRFANIGIKDPGGNYTILSMNLLVMVVDKFRIGNIPIPKTWGDILNSEFEKKVVIRGQNNYFCETILLTIYQQYGMDGIKKLGRSVKYGWHPSQMAKAAGSGSIESPVVSVMPYFFTKTIKHKENVVVIWPEEGAVISPVTMLVKSDKAKKLKRVTDFFTGRAVGQICAGANFPSLHPEVDNKIPDNAGFNWLGWDFLNENDVATIIGDISKEFLISYFEKSKVLAI